MDIDISVLRLLEREKELPFEVLAAAIEEALRLAEHAPGTVLVHERPGFETTLEDARGRAGAGGQPAVEWLDWAEAVEGAEPAAPVPVAATMRLRCRSCTSRSPAMASRICDWCG